MKTVIINENQKGFIFKNGKYEKTADAGRYILMGGRTAEIVSVDMPIFSRYCGTDTILADAAVKNRTAVCEVGDQQIALHFVNGKYRNALIKEGKYAFWAETDEHEFRLVDISSPEVGDSVPRYILDRLPGELYTKIEVAEYQKARVYFDCRLSGILDAGTYYFWNTGIKVTADYIDTRLTQMNITGQEIMTQDKVSLRINLVCNYRVRDCVRVLTEIDDFEEQLHVAAQLALRDYVSGFKLDEILESKDKISLWVFNKLKEKEDELFVEIRDAGIKDIILPGEIRDIMNTVLMAEKRAQAGVITRREEVASTRSLLNTAKLMEENRTLYKLKELEYLERICENVGSINLNGSGDVLGQLLKVLGADGNQDLSPGN